MRYLQRNYKFDQLIKHYLLSINAPKDSVVLLLPHCTEKETLARLWNVTNNMPITLVNASADKVLNDINVIWLASLADM